MASLALKSGGAAKSEGDPAVGILPDLGVCSGAVPGEDRGSEIEDSWT